MRKLPKGMREGLDRIPIPRYLFFLLAAAVISCWRSFESSYRHAVGGFGSFAYEDHSSGLSQTTPPDDSISLSLIKKNAVIQGRERDSWFHSVLGHENDGLKEMDLNTFYGGIMIQPSSVCPADLLKTASVSVLFDGGKWMCGASRLVGKARAGETCVVYSLLGQHVRGKL